MHPVFSSSKGLLIVSLLWLTICVLLTCFYLAFSNEFAIVYTINNAGEAFSQEWMRHIAQDVSAGFVLTHLLLLTPWFYLYLYFCAANFYICQRLPINETSALKLVLGQLGAGAVTVMLWAVLGSFWAKGLATLGLADAVSLFDHYRVGSLLCGMIFYCAWVLVHYGFLASSTELANSAETLEKKLLISEVELKAVKATVHPHFMYNSLSMLANLSLVDPERIHPICVQMSDFLRYSVTHGDRKTVTLADEIQHVENYLAVERERFGDHLCVNVVVADEAKSVTVFPLMLFPLVENSIKHGVSSQLEQGFISISAHCKDTNVEIEVKNSYDEHGVRKQGTRLGLTTLRKRIQGHFGNAASLQVSRGEGQFSVLLRLPRENTQRHRAIVAAADDENSKSINTTEVRPAVPPETPIHQVSHDRKEHPHAD